MKHIVQFVHTMNTNTKNFRYKKKQKNVVNGGERISLSKKIKLSVGVYFRLVDS